MSITDEQYHHLPRLTDIKWGLRPAYEYFNRGSSEIQKDFLAPGFRLNCFFFSLVWFGLGSLFNGISNFVGYLMPKLFFEKNSSGTI